MRVVLHFGGFALASASSLEHLVARVQTYARQQETPPLVVVSASQESTRDLSTLARLVREGRLRRQQLC